jgi:hypothetical protein
LKNYHGCPVQGTINAVSGKWKVLAIWHLGFHAKRFAELRKLLPGVSEKVLTSQLRQLETDGTRESAGLGERGQTEGWRGALRASFRAGGRRFCKTKRVGSL